MSRSIESQGNNETGRLLTKKNGTKPIHGVAATTEAGPSRRRARAAGGSYPRMHPAGLGCVARAHLRHGRRRSQPCSQIRAASPASAAATSATAADGAGPSRAPQEGPTPACSRIRAASSARAAAASHKGSSPPACNQLRAALLAGAVAASATATGGAGPSRALCPLARPAAGHHD
ncbi:unnamed protein product [Urochloa humidicola]